MNGFRLKNIVHRQLQTFLSFLEIYEFLRKTSVHPKLHLLSFCLGIYGFRLKNIVHRRLQPFLIFLETYGFLHKSIVHPKLHLLSFSLGIYGFPTQNIVHRIASYGSFLAIYGLHRKNCFVV